MKRSEVEGRIIMFDRGELDFTIIAACAQKNAAIALLIINNVHGPATKMSCDPDDPVGEEIQ